MDIICAKCKKVIMNLYAETEDCMTIEINILNSDRDKIFEKDGELQPVYCEKCFKGSW